MEHTYLSTSDLSARAIAEMLVRGDWRLVQPFAEAWWQPEGAAWRVPPEVRKEVAMRFDPPPNTRVTGIDDGCAGMQWLQRMTSAPETAVRIAPDDHLVPAFGEGRERCHRNAWFTWILREVGRIETDCTEQKGPVLAEGLHRRVFAWDPQQGRA